MSETTFPLARLAGELEKRKGEKLLLVTHERPDGDALGSLCGLCRLLRENGIPADAVLPEGVPDMYRGFLQEEEFVTELTEEKAGEYGALVYLDCARRDRASHPLLKAPLPFSLLEIGIDHHGDNPHYTRDISFVTSDAAATAQIVYFLAEEAGWDISEKCATFLLLGIITDCGCYRFDNTKPETLLASAALLKKGADHHWIISECYLQKEENLLLLEGEMVSSHLQKNADNTFACIYLSPELLEKYGVDIRNTEQLIDAIRPMKGLKGCAIIRKEGDAFKASLRSKEKEYSVGAVARELGGGGHEMAAGCPIKAPDGANAVRILFETVEKIWKKK